MLNVRSIRKAIPFMAVVLSVVCSGISWGAEQGNAPSKVAVLPFNMHTPSTLSYLQDGIRDMLSSRLGWQGKVQVIDKTNVDRAVKGVKGDIGGDDALRLAKSLGADYVLYGSVTGLGQSISIDGKMASVSGKGEPFSFFAQTKTLDEVIPQINQFAQNINQKIFARPGEPGQAAVSETDAASTRNPELLIPGSMIAGEKSSYLNPNFVEMAGDAALRQPGLWRSQTITGALMSMDIGDVDGDGRPEIVVVSKNRVTVYRKEGQGLKTVAVYDGTKVDNFLWVAVADPSHTGKADIFVTNLRKKNLSTPGGSEQILGNKGFVEELSSFALSLRSGKLQLIASADGYYLNAIELPKRGKLLVGQEKGLLREGAFKGSVYEMQVRGDRVLPTTDVGLPSRCNLFSCIKADINNDHTDEVINIDESNHLIISSPAGDQIWRSDKVFGATTNTFEGRLNDRRFNDVDFYSIPSPVVVTDLNKDGIPEILVNRNPDALAKFLPEGMKTYDKGEIVSLTWDQMGMVENWKTREISGMVTGLRMADLDGTGEKQLVVCMVNAKDLLKLGDAKSTIFSYELKAAGNKTEDKSEKKKQ